MTDQEQTKLHLTHTGLDAGTPFCPVNRAEAAARGERFGHVPYSNLEKFFKLPFLCADCKAVWDAAGDDDAE